MAAALDPEVEAQVLKVADAVGGLMEGWGFKRNMGRVWALLYLEGAPLSAADIGERLSLSTGAMSMLLTELQQWSVVKKTWVPGERRDYYEAETSIWKMVSRVFRERELRWIRDAAEQFAAADEALDQLGAAGGAGAKPPPGDEAARVAGIAAKVAGLSQLSSVGAALIENILSGESVDALPIKQMGDLAKAVKPPTS